MSTKFYTPEEAVEVLRMAALDAIDKLSIELDHVELGPASMGVMQLLHEAEQALQEEEV